MADASLTERNRARHADEAASWVRDRCEHLPPVEKAELFGTVFDRFADARVVLLGEATHGTSEFYRARAAITRRLIEHHGFNIVAIEADWPDAARVDRYARHKRAGRYDEETFARFPTWMWRNREFADFVAWLRGHNEGLADGDRAELRGLDVYSLNASIAAVIHYLDRVDPEAAGKARRRYGCLTPWQAEPAFYGRAMLRGGRDTCEDEVVAQLQELLDKRLEYAAADGEDFFDAAQNARVARAAEHYYRIMYHGSTESWNLRDRHMFDTLQHLMAARGDNAKAVVWAHNSHIGNAAATAMGWQGEFNIGELCRTAYDEDAVLIGFGTDRGTVAAADDWDGPMRIKKIVPSRPDSYERVFRQSGVARSLIDLRAPGNRELREVLSAPRLERAIGVIYREQSELLSHYFEAVLPEQFDAFVWFDETNAVTPLPAERPHGVAETYPFGVLEVATAATDLRDVRVEPEGLNGFVGVPSGAQGIVIFAHGSGSGRLSPRNNYVATQLRKAGLATFLLDLLTPSEEADRRNVFDIPLLASRLERATRWITDAADTAHLKPGYFGASTGAAAALTAAAEAGSRVAAIVSRGGRPDMALPVLSRVRTPTLLLVGSLDGPVIDMNRQAHDALPGEKSLTIVEGAGHLFEEPGKLDEVVRHATNWFLTHLRGGVGT